jgi:hypothetical protein
MHFIWFHVKFEDGLTVSVSKYKAACHKNLQLETVKLLKRSSAFKLRSLTLFHIVPFSDSRVRRNRFMSELPRRLEHIQKSQVMEMV